MSPTLVYLVLPTDKELKRNDFIGGSNSIKVIDDLSVGAVDTFLKESLEKNPYATVSMNCINLWLVCTESSANAFPGNLNSFAQELKTKLLIQDFNVNCLLLSQEVLTTSSPIVDLTSSYADDHSVLSTIVIYKGNNGWSNPGELFNWTLQNQLTYGLRIIEAFHLGGLSLGQSVYEYSIFGGERRFFTVATSEKFFLENEGEQTTEAIPSEVPDWWTGVDELIHTTLKPLIEAEIEKQSVFKVLPKEGDAVEDYLESVGSLLSRPAIEDDHKQRIWLIHSLKGVLNKHISDKQYLNKCYGFLIQITRNLFKQILPLLSATNDKLEGIEEEKNIFIDALVEEIFSMGQILKEPFESRFNNRRYIKKQFEDLCKTKWEQADSKNIDLLKAERSSTGRNGFWSTLFPRIFDKSFLKDALPGEINGGLSYITDWVEEVEYEAIEPTIYEPFRRRFEKPREELELKIQYLKDHFKFILGYQAFMNKTNHEVNRKSFEKAIAEKWKEVIPDENLMAIDRIDSKLELFSKLIYEGLKEAVVRKKHGSESEIKKKEAAPLFKLPVKTLRERAIAKYRFVEPAKEAVNPGTPNETTVLTTYSLLDGANIWVYGPWNKNECFYE